MKEGGIAAVADTVIAGWLTADFREREPQISATDEGDADGVAGRSAISPAAKR